MGTLELDNYSRFGTSGSGNQPKFWVNNYLVKVDSKFRESDKEVSACRLAEILGIYHARYEKIEALHNGRMCKCCISNSYLDRENESEITMYKILTLANVSIKQNDSAASFFNVAVKAVSTLTGISSSDVQKWLMQILVFDFIICNTDRHLTNICIIRNSNGKYRLGPIYDNGQSFLNTNGELTIKEIELRCRKYKSKPFSTNPKSNLIDIGIAKNLVIYWEKRIISTYGSISNLPINDGHKKILKYRINQLKETR